MTDSKDKVKNSVFTFISKLVEHLPYLNEDERLIFYTDGPSTDLENKFAAKMVYLISKN